MNEATLYTAPNCPDCAKTKKKMDGMGVIYSEVDLAKNEETLARVKGWGFQQAPVVDSPVGKWSGYRPDKLVELSSTIHAPRAEVPAAELGNERNIA